MLEAYVIQYLDDRFLTIVDGNPTFTISIADATMFHTPTEVKLIQEKFNLKELSTLQFVDMKLEEIK